MLSTFLLPPLEASFSGIESILIFNRLHRAFLAYIRQALYHVGRRDVSPAQFLLLYYIAPCPIRVTDLILRYEHLCSNPSYLLKKMVAKQYVIRQGSQQDARLCLLSLSDTGKHLYQTVEAYLNRPPETPEWRKLQEWASTLWHLWEESHQQTVGKTGLLSLG